MIRLITFLPSTVLSKLLETMTIWQIRRLAETMLNVLTAGLGHTIGKPLLLLAEINRK